MRNSLPYVRLASLVTAAVLATSAAVAQAGVDPTGPRAQAPPGVPAAKAAGGPGALDGSYVVVFEPAVSDSKAATGRRETALGFKRHHLYSHALKGFSARLSPGQVRQLREDPNVRTVTPNREVRSTSAPIQPGETVPTGVRRIEAATDDGAHEAADVTVAVIDSGIDLGHPDLNVIDGTDCRDDDGSPAEDTHGHGTHVAGTIAARNNGAGVIGVAPGTRLVAVRVLGGSGPGPATGTLEDVVCGIDWVTAHRETLNIRVANMSLSGGAGVAPAPCSSPTAEAEHIAICNATNAGVTFVAAAGNQSVAFEQHEAVPAAYPEVLTVTNMSDSDGTPGGLGPSPTCDPDNGDDKPAMLSNFGSTEASKAHTIAAPGTCIASTWKDGGYATLSGTSMAAPHVAGLVALCIGEGGTRGDCAEKTPRQILRHVVDGTAAYNTTREKYGFDGDPLRPWATNPPFESHANPYYGYLVGPELPAVFAPNAYVSGGKLVFEATPGDVNTVSVAPSTTPSTGSRYRLTDSTAPVVPGPGCAAVDANTVECSHPIISSLDASLRDGDDAVTVTGGLASTLSGGEGRDVLNGGSGDDVIDGGTGRDTIAGNDGRDTASYADRVNRVVIVIGGSANSGETGEQDTVTATIEDLVGGAGNDSLYGSASANTLDGGLGADGIDGAGGVDTVTYASRTQPVSVSNDNVDNDGEGASTRRPERDNVFRTVERITGGSGNDTLSTAGDTAANAISGGAGDDAINVLDGALKVTDGVDCGSGTDTVTRDPRDLSSTNCES